SREQGFTLTIRRRPPTRIRRSRRSRRRRPMGSLSASFEYVAQSQVLFSQPCDLLPHLIAFSAHQGEVLSCLRLHELLPLGAHPVIAQALPGSVEHPGSLLTVGQGPGNIGEPTRLVSQPFDNPAAGVGRLHRQGGKLDDLSGNHPVGGSPAAFPRPVSARRRTVPRTPPTAVVGQLG